MEHPLGGTALIDYRAAYIGRGGFLGKDFWRESRDGFRGRGSSAAGGRPLRITKDFIHQFLP